ncbi:uncharacterized protein [Drosophila takahashii]|uniref:uncharacterized protein n=1 Tax=Drosophila takahashii TaxID=29030 RepID=UPI0038993182
MIQGSAVPADEPGDAFSQTLFHNFYQLSLGQWFFQARGQLLHHVDVILVTLSVLLLPLQEIVHPIVLGLASSEPVHERSTQLRPPIHPARGPSTTLGLVP